MEDLGAQQRSKASLPTSAAQIMAVGSSLSVERSAASSSSEVRALAACSGPTGTWRGPCTPPYHHWDLNWGWEERGRPPGGVPDTRGVFV